MSNNSYNFYPRLDGLQLIEADSITTSDLTTNTLTANSFKTNLVQSINPTNSLTLEALTTGQVIIRSNGTNIAVFDTANNLITFNNRVTQLRSDNSVTYGPNCCLAPTGTTQLLTAYGFGALQRVTSGNFNTAFGYEALTNLLTGANNVGLGISAGRNITSGSFNMCIGLHAGLNLTTGNDSVAVGNQAGSGYNTGSNSVSIGTRAGLLNTAHGTINNNIAIGYEAGNGLITGANSNTMIGFRAGNSAFSLGWFNSTCIGAVSQITASNQITLGTPTQFTTTGNMSIGKTSFPTTKLDVEGSADFNGNVTIRNGNNLRIFNNGNTRQTNCYMLNDDLYMNNTSSIGTITFQINTGSICSISSSAINSNVYITIPNEPALSNNNRCANTAYVDNAVATGISGLPTLSGANAWTGNTNTFNSFLPTSTINPVTNNEFCRKGFCDTTYAGLASNNAYTGTNVFNTSIPTISTLLTPSNDQELINKGYADDTYSRLASSNTFTGLTNTFNSSVAFGTQAPTCSFAPTLNSSLANKEYVDKNAIVPPTKLFTLTEDFWTGTGGAPNGGFGVSVWATTGTGGASHAVGTNINHIGVWTLTNNRSVYNTDAVYSGVPKQVIWIVRETTALNTFNWYGGIIQSIGVFTNSAFIGHTSGGTTFFASVNNVNLYNFTSVTWAQNKWYEIKIDFNDPDVTFTLTNLTDNVTESFIASASSYDFARNNTLAFQHVSVAGTNTAEVDYVSMSYQCNRT